MKVDDVAVSETSQSVAYVLRNDALFFETAYKVLMGQDKDYFVPCAQSKWNGHTRIVYFTKEMTPLSQALPVMDLEVVFRALESLAAAASDISKNGFLASHNVVFDENRIYVDAATGMVRVIYLPLFKPVSGTDDNSACRALIEAMLRVIRLLGHKGQRLRLVESFLTHKARSFEDVQRIFAETADASALQSLYAQSGWRASFYLVPKSYAGNPIEIMAPGCTLGKSHRQVDISIDASPAISRMHCSFAVDQGRLFVMDQNSANGTYVNGRRVIMGQHAELRAGDELTLADVAYIVR